MLTNVINFILFQLGWFVTVAGAAKGYPWLGPLFTLLWLIIHLSLFSRKPAVELQFLIVCAIAGYIADSILVLSDLIAFPASTQIGWPSTIWMVALWINLGMTINYCLAWLAKHPTLIRLFGFLGGPVAYYIGSSLSAIILVKGITSLLAIGLLWAIATPALFRWSSKLIHKKAIEKITPLENGNNA